MGTGPLSPRPPAQKFRDGLPRRPSVSGPAMAVRITEGTDGNLQEALR
jgi:hypothetical protein